MLTRIYRWWLNGYPSEILEEMLKSAKKGSRKERIIKELLGYGSNENSNILTLEPRLKPLEIHSHEGILTLNKPSREELEALKRVLGLEKGSLQYKRKGDAVYLVTYDPETKGHKWKKLGSWSELKAAYLEGENS